MVNVTEVMALFARNSKQSGFVSKNAIASATVYTRTVDGRIVAAGTVEQGEDVTLVHNIAVDSAHRREGHGSEILREIVKKANYRPVEAKVRVGLASNSFFRANGWQKLRQTGDGEMNVWHAA